jgi:hypothetical protein
MLNNSRLAITACCYVILNTDQVNSAVITPEGIDMGNRERKRDLVVH